MIKRPFEINFIDPQEVRMGSPYNYCRIELIGNTKLILPDAGWQDKYAWSTDSKYLVLIKWNFENNIPGFHLFLIDTTSGKTKESSRIFGLPNDISIDDGRIKVNKFLYDKEKSNAGLCCNVEEDFKINVF